MTPSDITRLRELAELNRANGFTTDVRVDPQTIISLCERVEKLEGALKDCADEAESWIEGHYSSTKEYPCEMRRYERDIECVNRARSILMEGGK